MSKSRTVHSFELLFAIFRGTERSLMARQRIGTEQNNGWQAKSEERFSYGSFSFISAVFNVQVVKGLYTIPTYSGLVFHGPQVRHAPTQTTPSLNHHPPCHLSINSNNIYQLIIDR